MDKKNKIFYSIFIETNDNGPIFRLRRIDPETGIPVLLEYRDTMDEDVNGEMADLASKLRIAYEFVQAISLKGTAGEMESNTFDQFCNDSLDRDPTEKLSDARVNDLACRIASEQLEKISHASSRAAIHGPMVHIPISYHLITKHDCARNIQCREMLPMYLAEYEFKLRFTSQKRMKRSA